MTKRSEYIAFDAKDRFSNRVAYSASPATSKPVTGTRVFVPFSGFDGQKLAGSGALVFEGELLELKNH